MLEQGIRQLCGFCYCWVLGSLFQNKSHCQKASLENNLSILTGIFSISDKKMANFY